MIDINTGSPNRDSMPDISDKDLLTAIHLSETTDQGVTPVQHSIIQKTSSALDKYFTDDEQRYNYLKTMVFNIQT